MGERKYYRFVSSVRAVNKAITFSFVRNTYIIAAIEIVFWWTRVFRAVVTFIGIIAAIILSITVPSFLDASTVSASEFINRAIDICKREFDLEFFSFLFLLFLHLKYKECLFSFLFDQRFKEFAWVIKTRKEVG